MKEPQLRHSIPPMLGRLSWALKISAAVFPPRGHCKDSQLPEKSCMMRGMSWLVTLALGKDWQPEQSRLNHLPLPAVAGAENSLGMATLDVLSLFACFYIFFYVSCAHM